MASRPLPPNNNPAFVADYAAAIVYPAWFNPLDPRDPRNNYYRPETHGGIANRPLAWVLHTPEEEADDTEVTPAFFAGPGRQASTHYYLDSDGDVYQMVPEYCGAIANGLQGKPPPAWSMPGSLNWQTVNVEIEGRAHTIHQTMPVGGPQYNALVELVRDRARFHGIPLTRDRIIGHYEVSNQRSDPGAGFPWDSLIRDLNATPAPTPTRRNTGMYIIGLEGPAPDAYLVIPAPEAPAPLPEIAELEGPAEPAELTPQPLASGRFYLIPGELVADLTAMIYSPQPHEIRQATWDWLVNTCGFVRRA